jgi:hypothetical protein
MTEPAQLPDHINDLEKQSYKRDTDGNTALRVSNALVDSAGTEVQVDSNSKQLSVYDSNVDTTLLRMLAVLEDINFKLGIVIDK